MPGERDRNHGFHFEYLRKSREFVLTPQPVGRGSGENVLILKYVCVCVAAGADWERSEVVNSTQGFYSLMGLQPGTHYHLKIIHDNDTHWEKIFQTMGPGTPRRSPPITLRTVLQTGREETRESEVNAVSDCNMKQA